MDGLEAEPLPDDESGKRDGITAPDRLRERKKPLVNIQQASAALADHAVVARLSEKGKVTPTGSAKGPQDFLATPEPVMSADKSLISMVGAVGLEPTAR